MAEDVFESLKLKFTSGNDIPVERATITRSEYEELLLEFINLPELKLYKNVFNELNNPESACVYFRGYVIQRVDDFDKDFKRLALLEKEIKK